MGEMNDTRQKLWDVIYMYASGAGLNQKAMDEISDAINAHEESVAGEARRLILAAPKMFELICEMADCGIAGDEADGPIRKARELRSRLLEK